MSCSRQSNYLAHSSPHTQKKEGTKHILTQGRKQTPVSLTQTSVRNQARVGASAGGEGCKGTGAVGCCAGSLRETRPPDEFSLPRYTDSFKQSLQGDSVTTQ